MILPKEHLFWQTYGFASYHMNCRSFIRGVWPSQAGKPGNVVQNPSMESLRNFKPQGDFGGNPLDGTWWEELPGMRRLAAAHGMQGEIERVRGKLGIDKGNITKNYKGTLKEEKDNMAVAKILSARGNSIMLMKASSEYKVKSADILLNGVEWEIKTNRTPTISAIDNALRKAKTQAKNVILNIKSNISDENLMAAIKNRIIRTDIKKL